MTTYFEEQKKIKVTVHSKKLDNVNSKTYEIYIILIHLKHTTI